MNKSFKLGIIIGVIFTLVIVGSAGAAADVFKSWRTENGVVIQKAGNAYLAQAQTIDAPKLFEKMTNLDSLDDPLIIDVRTESQYNTCHIPGAIFIASYKTMAEPENLDKLDAALARHIKKTGNDDIVIYCNTGHTAGFLAGVLGSMGYDVKNLKFGYNIGWKGDQTKATGINAPGAPCEPVAAQ